MRKIEFSWLLAAAGVLMLSAVVRADEPKCTCSLAKAANQCGVPLLSKVPYVSRLFKNVGIGQIECEICVCPAAKDGQCVTCAAVEAEPACLAAVCKGGVCAANCCAEKCCAAKCCDEKLTSDSVSREIAELTAKSAVAEALLEARESSHAGTIELAGSMAELLAENASLTAKIEAREEHDKLVGQLLELAAENGRLKAQVELADVRVKLLQESIGVIFEKERLQRRVAELEHHLETAAARTAQRNGKLTQ